MLYDDYLDDCEDFLDEEEKPSYKPDPYFLQAKRDIKKIL